MASKQKNKQKSCDIDGVSCQKPKEHFKTNANKFKALSNPKRLEILTVIAKYNNKICCCDFEQIVDVKQPTISHHVKILMEAGLVKSHKEGTWMYYSIQSDELLNLMKELKDIIV